MSAVAATAASAAASAASASASAALPLAGKRGAVFGFASSRSLAFAIADAWVRGGAEAVTVGVQTARFVPALEKASRHWPMRPHVVECDLASDASLARAWDEIGAHHGARGLQMLAHSAAYASPAALRGSLLETARADFAAAHDASAFSLLALARGAAPLMARGGRGGSVVALSFIGARRAVPAYKVMGPAKASLEACARGLAAELGAQRVRVNVVSAGPIDTLAARGIPGFTALRDAAAARAPLALPGARALAAADVGALAAFLASDAAEAITGQTLYVDAGYSALA